MRVFSTARQRARQLGAIAALSLLAACATQAPASPPPPAGGEGGLCHAAEAEYGVGQAYTDALGAELQAKAHAKVLRVIRPGQAVTMDFRDDRLNVELDAAGKVKRVSCG